MTKQKFTPFIFALLGLCFYQISHAQVDISIGIRGGFMITNVDKSPLDQNEVAPENIAGLQVAVPIEIALGSLFAIQPEIMYGTHGGRQKDSETGTLLTLTTTTAYDRKYEITTLEIPVLAKLKFGTKNLKFHLLAGPSIGLGLGGKLEDETSTLSTWADGSVLVDKTTNAKYNAKFVKEGFTASDVDATDEFAVTKTNYNMHFGGGISVNLGGPFLFLDARYMLGLSDLRPEAEGDPKNYEYKSKRFGVSVGVMFPL